MGAKSRNFLFNYVHASTKPRFLTKTMHQKSGIPCSGWRCAVEWFDALSNGLMRCSFVKHLQDGFTSTHASNEKKWRCVAIVGFDALSNGLMRCSFVKHLQDGFTSTHASNETKWRCVAIVGFDALFFCKTFARWAYLNTRMR